MGRTGTSPRVATYGLENLKQIHSLGKYYSDGMSALTCLVPVSSFSLHAISVRPRVLFWGVHHAPFVSSCRRAGHLVRPAHLARSWPKSRRSQAAAQEWYGFRPAVRAEGRRCPQERREA